MCLAVSKSPGFYADNWNEHDHAPNTVPIEFGANMNLRFIVIPHKLEAFIGSEWRSTKTGRWTKAGARDISDLANARVPKYTASILFLEVIAYILGRNHISRSTDTDKRDAPQHNEDVRRKQEERE